MLHSVRIKKKNMCEVVWVCGLMSVYDIYGGYVKYLRLSACAHT